MTSLRYGLDSERFLGAMGFIIVLSGYVYGLSPTVLSNYTIGGFIFVVVSFIPYAVYLLWSNKFVGYWIKIFFLNVLFTAFCFFAIFPITSSKVRNDLPVTRG